MTYQDAALSVWQTLPDAELQSLTPHRFYDMIADLGLGDEDQQEAWYDFEDRRQRVFG